MALDWNIRGRTNAIDTLIDNSLLTMNLFDTNINADIFTAWVEQDLLPKTLENEAFHKRLDTQKAFKKTGQRSLFLSPYSPDLNRIERKLAQAKAMRRKHQCSPGQLFKIESLYKV